jgi:hypothetical protein
MRRSLLRALACALLLVAVGGAWGASWLPLGELEARLQLTPAQKAQFDAASAASQRALFAIGLAALQLQARIRTELGKDMPDVEGLLRDQDDAAAILRPQFEEARAEWAKLYGMLDARQSKIAREEIDARLAALERAAGELVRTLRDKLPEKARP